MIIKKIFMPLVMIMLSVSAYAGLHQPAAVEIVFEAGGGYAAGDMNTARFSDNEFEFIGCGTRAFDDGAGGVYSWGFCQAGLEEEGGVTCFVYDNPALLEGINVISDSSYITFSWDDDGEGNLTCNRVGASTQSFYLTKSGKSK